MLCSFLVLNFYLPTNQSGVPSLFPLSSCSPSLDIAMQTEEGDLAVSIQLRSTALGTRHSSVYGATTANTHVLRPSVT